MSLSYYINLILKLENNLPLRKKESLEIDCFDTSILIIDDMEDHSKTRDGKPCFYLTHSRKEVLEEARILQQRSFKALDNICENRKISPTNKQKIQILLTQLYIKIQQGEKINFFLEKSKQVKPSFLKKYKSMIQLFTGGHIKYAFLLAYTLTQNNPTYKKNVISIGEKIGMIRQIVDDINDYKENHHEPLGDLINNKKRLPELFFFLHSTNKEKSELRELLKSPKENLPEINNLIFNKKIQTLLNKEIAKLKKEIHADLISLPKRYKKALMVLVESFSFEYPT